MRFIACYELNKVLTIFFHAYNFSYLFVCRIVIYPRRPASGGIEIRNIHLKCLEEGRFLSDIIIDFYLLYIKSEIIPATDRDKVYLFSSFFFKRLISIQGKTEEVARQRFQLVEKWTKKINIFGKEFILIPINLQ